MIRPATPDDLPALLEMGRSFVEKAFPKVGFCADSCTRLALGLIENGICLVTEDRRGMIGIAIHSWHFNNSAMTATELFWWCENGEGAALRLAGEERVKALGIPTINMACEEHMRSPALDRLYRMNGYKPTEHIYTKELS